MEATLPTPWAGRDQFRADCSPGADTDGFGGFDVVRLCRQRTGRCSSCHCRLGKMPRSVDPGPNVLTNTSVAWMLGLSSCCLNWDFWDWGDFWDFVVLVVWGIGFWV